MNKYIYKFGKCEQCGEFKPLENGLCNECNAKDVPDFIKDLFKGKNDDTKRD
jgi:hypothetical protein